VLSIVFTCVSPIAALAALPNHLVTQQGDIVTFNSDGQFQQMKIRNMFYQGATTTTADIAVAGGNYLITKQGDVVTFNSQGQFRQTRIRNMFYQGATTTTADIAVAGGK
jgi:hypothetical protein